MSAELLSAHRQAVQNNVALSPFKVMELVLKSLQLSSKTNSSRVITKFLFEWLNAQWIFISKNQNFLLKSPNFYRGSIEKVRLAKNGKRTEDVIELLQTILPTIGFQNENENEIMKILQDLKRSVLQ